MKTVSIRRYVSKNLFSEIVMKSISAMESIKHNLEASDIENMINSRIDEFDHFMFVHGTVLKSMEETMTAYIEGTHMKQPATSKEEFAAIYKDAREHLSEEENMIITDMSMHMAESSMNIINKVRYELPKSAKTMHEKILEKAESAKEDYDPTHMESANSFDWGRLNDFIFLEQVKSACNEIDRTFTSKSDPFLAFRLSNIISRMSYGSEKVDTSLRTKIAEKLEENDMLALETLFDTSVQRDLARWSDIVFSNDITTGRYYLIPFFNNVENTYTGLKALEDVVYDLEGNDSLKARLNVLEKQLFYSYGACQVLRESIYKDSLIVPVEVSLNDKHPPKGNKLFFNEDVRDRCDFENPEDLVTKIYNYYHGSNLRVSQNGMSIKNAKDLKNTVEKILEERHKDIKTTQKHAFQNAVYASIESILEENISDKKDDIQIMSLHRKSFDRLLYQVAHGVGIMDELMNYLAVMDGNKALETFQKHLFKSVDSIHDENQDVMRDKSFVSAYTDFIGSFLKDRKLVV